MTVYELNRDQLNELKQQFYYTDFLACRPHGIEADAPDELPDSIIYEWYAEYTFTNDDFLCTAKRSTRAVKQMKLSYSIEAQGGTIYIWDDATDKILHVIESKEEAKALLDVLTELYQNL